MATASNNIRSLKQPHSCVHCKSKSHMFRLLSKDDLNKINENRCQVHYKAGETIRKQGAYLSQVISVTSGLCKMFLEGIESRNVILRIIKPTNFIGGPGLYVDHRHHFTVSALTDATVCFIDIKTFKSVMEQNQEFADEFMQDMSRNMISIYDRIISLTQKQMAGRVADALLYFSDEIFENRNFELPLSKQEIADFTKMSKDNVVRIIKSFHREEVIAINKNSVEIIDYDKLQKISSIG